MTPSILVVTPHYPPHRLGGTQLRAHKLARGLVSLGASVEILCVEELQLGDLDSLAARQDTHEGIVVHRLYLTQSRHAVAFENSYLHPGIEEYLETLVTAQRPDLVHLISGYLITAAALAVAHKRGIPVAVTITDHWFICPRINLIRSNGELCDGPHNALDCTRCLLGEGRRYRIPEQVLPRLAELAWNCISKAGSLKAYVPLYEKVRDREGILIDLLNKADAVILPTSSLRTRLVRAGAKDRFTIVRHSITPKELGITRGAPKSPSPSFRFGYLGQVLYLKGVDLLVQAFMQVAAQYEDVSLTVWGETTSQLEFAGNLAALVGNTPRVAMRGRYEPVQLGDLLRDIDVLVVPSRCPEIGPFVILEAFATMTPVIGARIGNIPELVEHDVSGLLFQADSAADLQAQMQRLLDEPNLYSRLRSGVPFVRTQDDEMTELVGIYARITEGRVEDFVWEL